MKINIKKLFFKTPEKIDKSSVEIEVVLDEKTKAELFNEEVSKLVKSKLVDTLAKKLTKMCYTDDEWEQTLKAATYKGKEKVSDLYPKAVYEVARNFGGYDSYVCNFNLRKFCVVLVGDV